MQSTKNAKENNRKTELPTKLFRISRYKILHNTKINFDPPVNDIIDMFFLISQSLQKIYQTPTVNTALYFSFLMTTKIYLYKYLFLYLLGQTATQRKKLVALIKKLRNVAQHLLDNKQKKINFCFQIQMNERKELCLLLEASSQLD